MKISDIRNVMKDYGEGATKALSKNQLRSLYNICNNVRKCLIDTCSSHALYRCTIYSSIEGNIIVFRISCSNDQGLVQELQIGYDLDTNDIYTYRIALQNKEELIVHLAKLIDDITTKIPVPIGMLDFPLEGNFDSGKMAKYKLEEGSVIIVIDDSKNYSYFLEY